MELDDDASLCGLGGSSVATSALRSPRRPVASLPVGLGELFPQVVGRDADPDLDRRSHALNRDSRGSGLAA